jgi:hypothetical protein
MRILLSEGSGLTSRQVAGRLGSLGHEVEILSSSKICLTRADLLFPTQEQVTVLFGTPEAPARRDYRAAFREPRASTGHDFCVSHA